MKANSFNNVKGGRTNPDLHRKLPHEKGSVLNERTDEERMEEALAKYSGHPWVVKVSSLRFTRSDGSTYLAPCIQVKPDLSTVSRLVSCSGVNGSSFFPVD